MFPFVALVLPFVCLGSSPFYSGNSEDHFTDAILRGDALLASLAERFNNLAAKVDLMDTRISQDMKALRSTIGYTHRDVRTLASKVERLEKWADLTNNRPEIYTSQAMQAAVKEELNLLYSKIASKIDASVLEVANGEELNIKRQVGAEKCLEVALEERKSTLQFLNSSFISIDKSLKNMAHLITSSHKFGECPEHQADSDTTGPSCPDDVETVAALQEVKSLLQSVLSKSEDLRRALSRQAAEAQEILQHMHQRFSVLLRRLNSDPLRGKALEAEVQEIEHLIRNSYSSILHAQNTFIESCHRIQEEQPTLELKIAEILDKLVESIEYGHQFNRRQLTKLHLLVERLRPSPTSLSPTTNINEDVLTATDLVLQLNETTLKLQAIGFRIQNVSHQLHSRDDADSFITASKDLLGIATKQAEILESLLQQLGGDEIQKDSGSAAELPYLVLLPSSCTTALLQQLNDYEKLTVLLSSSHPNKTHKRADPEKKEDSLPQWYYDPDFRSGNFGTPERKEMVFRNDEWIYPDEDAVDLLPQD